MIPFDFEYYVPETVEEAVELFAGLEEAGKEPLYYSGGTEIITFCRQQIIKPGALVDLKAIPESCLLEKEGDKLVLGANLSLDKISEQVDYPLLAEAARAVADKTVRNRLTLGGNICGRLPYREAILPLLLADAEAMLAGPEGRRTEPLRTVFDKRLKLAKGEMLVRLTVPRAELDLKSWSRRRVKHGPVDYPLCHLAGVKKEGYLALAVSGLCAFAFRSDEVEKVINDTALAPQDRAGKTVEVLPGPVRNDGRSSADYRQALWQKDLTEMLEEMEGAGR